MVTRAMIISTALAVLVAGATPAEARTLDPGSIWASGGVGFGTKMGGRVGGSAAGTHLLLIGSGEYAFDTMWTAVGSVALGLADAVPLRFRLGARYRFTGLDLPLSPYAQLQLSVGRLFDVLGANLSTAGAFVGGGADYFLTADLSVGGLVGVDISSTLGEFSSYYGTFELAAVASYSF